MKQKTSLLFWLEAGLAALCAALLVLTLALPEWIEELTGLEPDGGNGTTEWAFVAGLALATAALIAAARHQWSATRRAA